jgi:hypothetical protein
LSTPIRLCAARVASTGMCSTGEATELGPDQGEILTHEVLQG